MGSFKKGSSLAEYALPTAIMTVILIGGIAALQTEILNLFGNTLNSDKNHGNKKIVARPYSTLVNPSDVVFNFNEAYVRGIIDNMEMNCISSASVCVQTTKAVDGIETSGAVGTKKFLDKQLRRILTAFDSLLDKPGNEDIKKKFRDLANISFEIAQAQRELARAIKKGDKAKIDELIKKINGGSVTYREEKDGKVTLTTVSGKQAGSLIDQLRQLRGEILADPRLGSVKNGPEALDALYDVLEFDALSASKMVNGPPPSTISSVSISDLLGKESGLSGSINLNTTSGDYQVVSKTTTGSTGSTSTTGVKNVMDVLKTDTKLMDDLFTLAGQEKTVTAGNVSVASSLSGSIKPSGKFESAADEKAYVQEQVQTVINKAATSLASNKDYMAAVASGDTAKQQEAIAKVLKSYTDGKGDGIDNKVADALYDSVKSGSGNDLTSAISATTAYTAEKKDLTNRINMAMVSSGKSGDTASASGVVDTATKDSTVMTDIKSGTADSTDVATKVAETTSTDKAADETASAASDTEKQSTVTCSVGDGKATSGAGNAGATGCIG